jgi:hypothetical protein
MYFRLLHRAIVFISLLSLFLAVCAAPTFPSQEDVATGAVKKLKQFDIRNPTTKTRGAKRGAPSGFPRPGAWKPNDGSDAGPSSSFDGEDNSSDGYEGRVPLESSGRP